MPRNQKDDYILIGIIGVFVVWFSLLIAPFIGDGLIYALEDITNSLNHPFTITWCKNSLGCLFVCVSAYLLGVLCYYSDMKNFRKKEEYGSAKWGNWRKANRKFAKKKDSENKVLSQNLRIAVDNRYHHKNVHTLVIGGSSAGKTRFFCKPNIMQCNSSFVVLDPKAEMLKDLGYLLEKEGYVIRYVDLIEMSKSHCYNPFKYIHSDQEIIVLITNLIQNTTPKGSSPSDPFWDRSEVAFLSALFLYLYHEAPEDEQNFEMVMEMFEAAEVKDDDPNYKSALDILFDRLSMRDPRSLACKEYAIFKKAPPKTAMSILISVGVRLAKFYILSDITNVDELELDLMGERKQALFCIIPDNDSSFNFFIGILYTQLFQTLYQKADRIHDGGLPVPVHFVMDEFANVSLPDDFGRLLATMRSRNIYVSIILQNLNQLKNMFKDSWESILGLCDSLVYLGGNEKSTHQFVSEYLGKETIDILSRSKQEGGHGTYTTNYQQIARDLMTPDEVRKLDGDYCVSFINGQDAIIDRKYDILKHPNIQYTKDGGAKPYLHGVSKYAIQDWQNIEILDDDFEIYSEENLYEYFKMIENKKKVEELLYESRKKME